MLRRLKKNTVCTGSAKNEGGFTFISMILAITILSLTLPMLAFLIQSVKYETTYEALSIHQFLYFLRDDMLMTSEYTIKNNELYLKYPDDSTVMYIQSGSLIIRKVDGEGYEIYLRDIKDISFQPLSYGVRVIIQSKDGERFEKVISLYK